MRMASLDLTLIKSKCMNKLEYIPRDLVMTNGVPLGTAKDVVYRVTSSNPSKTLELDDGTVLKGVVCLENIEGAEFGDKGYLSGDCCAWVKDIVPINLVPAILEKNGWKNYCYGLYWFPNEECTGGIGLSNYTSYAWNAYIGRHLLRININSVSDLQHLLFGLGLNSEMEV